MATIGQFYWPSGGTFVAAYGQFFMAANKAAQGTLRVESSFFAVLTWNLDMAYDRSLGEYVNPIQDH